jgi:hypothetical protein
MSRSRPRRRPDPDGLLHHLAAVLSLAGRKGAVGPSGLASRRRRQRLELAQRLLDPLPEALLPASRNGERFWSAMRWGGFGLLVAWLLRR